MVVLLFTRSRTLGPPYAHHRGSPPITSITRITSTAGFASVRPPKGAHGGVPWGPTPLSAASRHSRPRPHPARRTAQSHTPQARAARRLLSGWGGGLIGVELVDGERRCAVQRRAGRSAALLDAKAALCGEGGAWHTDVPEAP